MRQAASVLRWLSMRRALGKMEIQKGSTKGVQVRGFDNRCEILHARTSTKLLRSEFGEIRGVQAATDPNHPLNTQVTRRSKRTKERSSPTESSFFFRGF